MGFDVMPNFSAMTFSGMPVRPARSAADRRVAGT
jgi:hypothetical protein